MRKALEAGRFGKLSHGSIHVRWNRNRDYYDQAKWRGTWAQDGGALMNQCIHGIDLLRWMMGEEIDGSTASPASSSTTTSRPRISAWRSSSFKTAR